jgi:hypothetical protein
MKRKVIAIAGIETIRDAQDKVLKFSVTFINNITTWVRDHPKDDVVLLDARKYVECKDPIASLWHDVQTLQLHGLDLLLYSGHSDPDNLYVFSRTRTDLEDSCRFLSASSIWEAPYTDHAEIKLMGCQTAGRDGHRLDVCVAQGIADATQHAVWGFVSKSSQQKRNKGYYMVPDDKIGYVKVLPRSEK